MLMYKLFAPRYYQYVMKKDITYFIMHPVMMSEDGLY